MKKNSSRGSKENKKSDSNEPADKEKDKSSKNNKSETRRKRSDSSFGERKHRTMFATKIGNLLNKMRREKSKNAEKKEVKNEPVQPQIVKCEAEIPPVPKNTPSISRRKPTRKSSDRKPKNSSSGEKTSPPPPPPPKPGKSSKTSKTTKPSRKTSRTSETTNSSKAPKPIDPSKVEKSIENLIQQLEPKCTAVFEEQWEYIDNVEVYDNDCLAFLEHQDWNQAEEVECLDSNRVKLDKIDTRNYDYIHASHVEIKGVARKFILAQLPIISPKRLGDFFAMIYQEKLHNLYFLCSPEESNRTDKLFSEYFPMRVGDHENYEQIWVHNRKFEAGTEISNDIHTIEVLPNGCAESVMICLQMLDYWADRDIGAKIKRVLGSAESVFGNADAYEEDPIGILSKQGSGRAGTYLAIICAIYLVKNGENINLKEMCRSIREQRPGAIDNYFQFVFIYQCVLKFAEKHVNKKIRMKIEKILHQIDFILAHKAATAKKVPLPTGE